MYEAFFGLKEPPFQLTPNPRFLFLTAAHREALATLGLIAATANHLFSFNPLPEGPLYGLASEEHWPAFMAGAVPELKQSGWLIRVAPDDTPESTRLMSLTHLLYRSKLR